MAAWLFWRGLDNFTHELRRAYAFICAGIILFGLAQAQFTVIVIFNWLFWLHSGLITVLYLLSGVPLLIGVRRLARILDIRTRWSSLPWVAALALTVVAACPQQSSRWRKLWRHRGNRPVGRRILFMCHDNRTQGKAAHWPRYTNAMAWLSIALGVIVLAGLHFVVVQIGFARETDWYHEQSMTVPPFLLGSLLLLRAGYAMTALQERQLKEKGSFLKALYTSRPNTPSPLSIL